MALQVKQLTKIYHASKAGIQDISFHAPQGSIISIVGPSGSGKTTLLKIIAGLIKPQKGIITVNDIDVTDFLPEERNMTMVFQQGLLYPHMPVQSNISFPLRIRHLPARQIRRAVGTIASELGITDLLTRWPATLSGGQKQLVSIAKSLISGARVILMDEPLDGIDEKRKANVRDIIRHYASMPGRCCLYVTHDQAEAMRISNQVIILSHGQMRQIGSPEQIYEQPADSLVAGFFGSPAMNMIPVAHLFDDDLLPLHFDMLKDYKSAMLSFRPHHAIIAKRNYGTTNELSIKAKYQRTEFKGDSYESHFKLATTSIRVTSNEPVNDIKPDSNIFLIVPNENIYIFEKGHKGKLIKKALQ